MPHRRVRMDCSLWSRLRQIGRTSVPDHQSPDRVQTDPPLSRACPHRFHDHEQSGRGESGWCSDMTSTHGAWRHAGIRFLLSGGLRQDMRTCVDGLLAPGSDAPAQSNFFPRPAVPMPRADCVSAATLLSPSFSPHVACRPTRHYAPQAHTCPMSVNRVAGVSRAGART